MNASGAWLDLSEEARAKELAKTEPSKTGRPNGAGQQKKILFAGNRWIWPGIFLLLLISWTIYVGPSEISHWKQAAARQAIIDGDYPAAIENIGQAIEWTPDDYALLLQRGDLKLHEQDRAGAIEDATQAADAMVDLPSNMRAVPLAMRAYACGIGNIELKQGLEDIQQAFELAGRKNDSYMLHAQGLIYYRLGRLPEAWESMTLALIEGESQLGRQINQRKHQMNMLVDRRTTLLEIHELNKSLAAIYSHRIWVIKALVERQMGKAETIGKGKIPPDLVRDVEFSQQRIKEDQDRIRNLGFDPSQEIW